MVDDEAEKDFPSRPPQEAWAGRLRRAADAARADPCQARLVLASYDRQAGFTSRINTAVDEMLYGLYGNYSMALCASSATDSYGGFYEKVMRHHFQNAAGLPVCISNRSFCGESHTGYTHYPGERLSSKLAKHHADYLLTVKGFILSSLFLYSEETRSRIEQRLERVGLRRGSPYIAVHIRRGDKWMERFDLLSTARYAEEIAKLRNSSSGSAAAAGTVFLATDDRTVPRELQELLGSSIKVLHQDWSEGVLDRAYNDDEEVLQLLTDLEGLRGASHFIGTVSSNVGRLVYLLRGRDLPSISMDGNGNWLDREAARKKTTGNATPVR